MLASCKLLSIAAVSGLLLAGCTAEGFRGVPAASVDECRGDWERDRHAANAGIVATGNVAALVLTTLVSTAASVERRQAADDRFRQCLLRFGVSDADAFLATVDPDTDRVLAPAPRQSVPAPFPSAQVSAPLSQPVAPPAPALTEPTQGCPVGASVLFGGVGYCTN